MTISPDVTPVAFDSPAAAMAALRQRGLRLSTARRLVLDALFRADGPASASQIAQALSLDETSVYRNLELLESHGMVRHVHLGHGPGLYVLARGGEDEYLYCESCATLTPVTPGELDGIREQIKEQFGFAARFNHFAMAGVCERCAAKAAQAARRSRRAASRR